MTRGFLIVDQKMNTVILPVDDPDIVELLRYKPGHPGTADKIHHHGTLKELDADIRAFIKGEYKEDTNGKI